MSFLKKVQAASKYSVMIELNENGSSDFVTELTLSKAVVEGLKGLSKKRESELKKLLKDVFDKVAAQKDS